MTRRQRRRERVRRNKLRRYRPLTWEPRWFFSQELLDDDRARIIDERTPMTDEHLRSLMIKYSSPSTAG